MTQSNSNRRFPVAKEGWGYAIGLLALGFFAVWMKGNEWAVFFFVLAFCVIAFFRDPDRTPPDDPGTVVSPADGRVIAIENSDRGGKMVGIFLAIYDVHINRSPVEGSIQAINYRAGKFLAAFNKEAARMNEQNAIDIQTNSGENFRVVQIAGLIARRIVNWRLKGDNVEKGERLGLIQFGSRTDIYMPQGYAVSISMGDRVRGGETIIGRSTEK